MRCQGRPQNLHLKSAIISMINGKHLCRLSSYEYEQHMVAVDNSPPVVNAVFTFDENAFL